MVTPRKHGSPPYEGPGRRAGASLHPRVLVAGALACLAIASLIPTTAATTVGPPFHGYVQTWGYENSGGCGYGLLPVHPHYNRTTGVAGWNAVAKAHGCAGQGGGGYLLFNGMRIEIPVRPGSGYHSFALDVAYHVSGRESISIPTSCPPVRLNAQGNGNQDCRNEAAYSISISAGLIDWTAHLSYGSSSYFYVANQSYAQNYTGCVAGNCSYQNVTVGPQGTNSTIQHGNLNYTVATTTNGSHTYTVQLWISVSVGAFCTGYPGASAFARAELAGASNFVQLQSLTVT